MPTNPFEPPREVNEPAEIRVHLGSEKGFYGGVLLILIAVALPLVTWFGAPVLIFVLAPGDPLPQGAMVIALLVFLVSLPTAIVALFVGVYLVGTNRRW